MARPKRFRTPDPQIRSLGSDIDSSQLFCKPSIKELIADQYVNHRAANRESHRSKENVAERQMASTGDFPSPRGDGTTSKRGVRGPSAAPGAHRDCNHGIERPAHPSNLLVAQLNETWRVMEHPLQWRLQRKKGNPRTNNSGWRDRSFCATREGLLRCVREYCGNVEPAAFAELLALPEHHTIENLDVRGTSRARVQ